jgi:hypothetical protein
MASFGRCAAPKFGRISELGGTRSALAIQRLSASKHGWYVTGRMQHCNDLYRSRVRTIDDQVGAYPEKQNLTIRQIFSRVAFTWHSCKTIKSTEEFLLQRRSSFRVIGGDKVPDILKILKSLRSEYVSLHRCYIRARRFARSRLIAALAGMPSPRSSCSMPRLILV